MWSLVQRISNIPAIWDKLEAHFQLKGEFSPLSFSHMIETGWKNLSEEHMATTLDVAIEKNLSMSKFFFIFILQSVKYSSLTFF